MDLPNPSAPVSFPDNFPLEIFYWSASTDTAVTGGGTITLTLAQEGAFANEIVQAGDQIVFSRIRIRGGNLPNGTYRVTHPYGVETFNVTAPGSRQINFTEDFGIAPGVFTGSLGSRIGPFLTWDPAVTPAAPIGYIGTPVQTHTVSGSPIQSNELLVELVTPAGTTVVGRNSLFAVSGKIAGLTSFGAPKGGTYNTPPTVTLVASVAGAQVYYTLDGTDPRTSASRVLYTAPFAIPALGATLKHVAIQAVDVGPVVTEVFIIQSAPTVTPPVQGGPAAGTTLAATSIPVPINWSGADPNNDIIRFDLEVSTAGAPFAPVVLANPLATSQLVNLAAGTFNQFRVRAIDATGQMSAWSLGPIFQVTAIQENTLATTYLGRWSSARDSRYFGGTARASVSSGATATTRFSGSSVAFVTTVASNRGIAEILIDGVSQGRVDLYNPTFVGRRVVFSTAGLQPGPHTLVVRVTGLKNIRSADRRVDIDGFIQTNSTVLLDWSEQ